MRIHVLGFEQRIERAGPRDWVHFTSRDAFTDNGQVTHSTWERVSRMIPPEGVEDGPSVVAMRAMWAQIEPAYKAWQAGNEMPEAGTPLSAWHALGREQAEVLRLAGFRTVEDLAAASENMLAKPPLPNMRDLKRQAEAWIKGADRAATEKRIGDLEAQLEAALEMLAAKADDDKPKRGRPPKVREDEAA